MEQPKQPNAEYIIRSLQQQMMNQTMMIAERDAVITEQHQEIELYKKKVEKLEGEKEGE